MKCVRDDNGNNNTSKCRKKNNRKRQKKKKNVHFFDTIYGSFGRVRHIFHVKFATHRTESEHVHQIFYSMIPFAFMLVAYCMRFPLCSYYIMAHVTTNTNTYTIHGYTHTYSHTHTCSRIDTYNFRIIQSFFSQSSFFSHIEIHTYTYAHTLPFSRSFVFFSNGNNLDFYTIFIQFFLTLSFAL